eukprot:3788461-Prymnesium_polylepis.3
MESAGISTPSRTTAGVLLRAPASKGAVLPAHARVRHAMNRCESLAPPRGPAGLAVAVPAGEETVHRAITRSS